MTHSALKLAAASVLGICLVSPAVSQQAPTVQAPACGVRTDIVKKLSSDFKEAPMAVGMVDQSAVLEIFVSDVGTWTILASRPDGTSCIVSAGEGWQSTTLIAGQDA